MMARRGGFEHSRCVLHIRKIVGSKLEIVVIIRTKGVESAKGVSNWLPTEHDLEIGDVVCPETICPQGHPVAAIVVR